MKKTLLYIFAAALAALLSLQSCGLEEPFNTPQISVTEGVVELVARPVSYNNHDVTTKADGGFNDAAIHNAFLILFNTDGQRILFEEINIADEQLSAKIDKGLGDVTACILANVPADFARGITGLEGLNTAVLDLKYDYSKSGILGVPILDLDQDNKAVPCIPMFGQTNGTINLSNANSVIGIDLTRLFAKITVDLSLNVNLDNAGDALIGSATYFEMSYCNLKNMPKKVRLVESDSQSDWYNDKDSFSDLAGGPRSLRVYNRYSSATFTFYAPEYYLNSIDKPLTDEKQKPNNVKSGTYPIYLFLNGTYSQYSFNSTKLDYKVYLGRNEYSDFSLARNVNYINYLNITGINNHDGEGAVDVDYRVTTTIINNPVAKEGKSANCYIIAAEGEYSFPAYKGAYNDLTDAVLCNRETAKELVVAKNDNSNNILLSGLDYNPDQNMISFKIEKFDEGNVVIELKNKDGSTEWSWHLWCNKESTLSQILPGDFGAWGKLNNHTYPNGSIMMDRNLGASSTSATGLYYKYGSKNPFIADKYYGGGSNGSATWQADGKAVNDPCPPGYRVPSSNVWKGFTPTKENSSTYNAFIFWKENTGDINLLDDIYVYYPYSGYVENGSTQTSKEVPIPLKYNETIFYEVTTGLVNVYRAYTNIKYTVNVTTKFGMLCGSNEVLECQMVTKDSGSWFTSDFTVTEVTWYKGERKRVGGSLFNPVYEIQYDYSKPYTLADISRTEQVNWATAKTTVIDPELDDATEDLSYNNVTFSSVSNVWGYNVRCVKE